MRYVVDIVKTETGLRNFGEWLTSLLEFDRLILNEDRHFHNIGFILKDDGKYRLMPFFDNGAGLCSDSLGDYPMSMPINVAISDELFEGLEYYGQEIVQRAKALLDSQMKYARFGQKEALSPSNVFS
jgi:hypothetical protein